MGKTSSFCETSRTDVDKGMAISAAPTADVAKLRLDAFAAMASLITSRQSSGSGGVSSGVGDLGESVIRLKGEIGEDRGDGGGEGIYLGGGFR